MLRGNIGRVFEICNCAGNFDNFEVTAGTKVQPVGCGCKKLADVRRECQVAFNVLVGKITVVFITILISVTLIFSG